MKRGMFAWDKGVEFEEVRVLLAKRLKKAKTPLDKARFVVLLTALVNGARLSEAIEAVVRWAGEREIEVAVRKRKGVRRKIIFPSELTDVDLRLAKRVLAPVIAKDGLRAVMRRLSAWCGKVLGFNPHSLRYAFISYLAKKGVAAQVIAKITGHSKLDFVLHYTQKTIADEVLKEVAQGL